MEEGVRFEKTLARAHAQRLPTMSDSFAFRSAGPHAAPHILLLALPEAVCIACIKARPEEADATQGSERRKESVIE
jgi:hypothetical protein